MIRHGRGLLLGLVVMTLVMPGCMKDPVSTTAKRVLASDAAKAVFPGPYRFDGSFSYTLATGVHESLPVEIVQIPSKVIPTTPNGRIWMGLWRPATGPDTRVPIIVTAGPSFDALWDVPVDKPSSRLGAFLIENFVPHGYAVAQLAVRGTSNHGGCMEMLSVAEQTDLSTAIEWLGTQPWSNGNVAMIGRAYDGSTPWEVAARGNPYLKTIVPISGIPDFFDLLVHNGTSETRAPGLLQAVYYAFGFASPNRSAENVAANAICPEALRGLATAVQSTVTGERGPSINDYYHVRDLEALARQAWHGSLFLVNGFQNWDVEPHTGAPLADQMEREGYKVKQLWGQWHYTFPDRPIDHANVACGASNTRWDWAEILLHWFDHELKGLSNVDTGPPVQVLDAQCRWRNESNYPPRDATWTRYHLGNNLALTSEPGSAGSVLIAPTGILGEDSRFWNLPGYKADFRTAPLERGIQVSGLPRLHVTVTPHGPAGHLTAWLYSVSPNGTEMRLSWTQMNLLFAAGGETARPYVPNSDLVAKLEFEPMDAYVPEGDRILVRLWQHTYADHLPAIPPQPVTLKFGGAIASTLDLPIVVRGPEVFFTPPRPLEP